MSNSRAAAASLGALAGFAYGLRNYRRQNDRELSDNEDTATDALSLSQDNQRRLDEMLANGDFKRLADDHVSDFLVGLSFPDQAAPSPPSAFATIPAVCQLPNLPEALAMAPASWPGPTNPYNEDGTLKQPASALIGQNVALGIALGNPSVRAFLLGLTETTLPSADKLAQLHRLTRALVTALGLREGNALTYTGLVSVWQALLNPAAPQSAGTPSGILWSQIANAPLLSNFTAEAVIYSVQIPAGCMQPGQAVVAQVSGFTIGAGSGNTVVYRAHLDSIGGPTVLLSPTLTQPGPDVFDLRVQLARGADVGGSAVFVVTPSWAVPAQAGSAGADGTTNTLSFDHSVSHNILFTASYSTAATGNAVQGQAAMLRKL